MCVSPSRISLGLLLILAVSCSPVNSSYDKNELYRQNAAAGGQGSANPGDPGESPSDGFAALQVLVYKTQLLSSDALTMTLKAGAAAQVNALSISEHTLPERLEEFKREGKTSVSIRGSVPSESTGLFELNLSQSELSNLQGQFDTSLAHETGDVWTLSISSATPTDIREKVLTSLVSILITAKKGTWRAIQNPPVPAASPSPSPSPSPSESR